MLGQKQHSLQSNATFLHEWIDTLEKMITQTGEFVYNEVDGSLHPDGWRLTKRLSEEEYARGIPDLITAIEVATDVKDSNAISKTTNAN